MQDIKCEGKKCEQKKRCLRFLELDNVNKQTYFGGNVRDNEVCKWFLEAFKGVVNDK